VRHSWSRIPREGVPVWVPLCWDSSRKNRKPNLQQVDQWTSHRSWANWKRNRENERRQSKNRI